MSTGPPHGNGQDHCCRICKVEGKRVFMCIQCCEFRFCDDCWSLQAVHEPGLVGWGGQPHEKSDPNVVKTLQEILERKWQPVEHESELIADYDTTWFGVGRGNDNQPVFQDHGRFATLMGENSTDDSGSRYPQLVTFIGQTGQTQPALLPRAVNKLTEGRRRKEHPNQDSHRPLGHAGSPREEVSLPGHLIQQRSRSNYRGRPPLCRPDDVSN